MIKARPPVFPSKELALSRFPITGLSLEASASVDPPATCNRISLAALIVKKERKRWLGQASGSSFPFFFLLLAQTSEIKGFCTPTLQSTAMWFFVLFSFAFHIFFSSKIVSFSARFSPWWILQHCSWQLPLERKRKTHISSLVNKAACRRCGGPLYAFTNDNFMTDYIGIISSRAPVILTNFCYGRLDNYSHHSRDSAIQTTPALLALGRVVTALISNQCRHCWFQEDGIIWRRRLYIRKHSSIRSNANGSCVVAAHRLAFSVLAL